jgi:hypothetical protein
VITFDPLAPKTTLDPDFTPSTSTTSGLPVTLASDNPAVATIVNGTTIDLVGAGTATITASQPGNATYAPATSLTQTLTVAKAAQTITFPALSAKQAGDAAFNLPAFSSSGLPITYASLNPSVATVSGSLVTLTGLGLCGRPPHRRPQSPLGLQQELERPDRRRPPLHPRPCPVRDPHHRHVERVNATTAREPLASRPRSTKRLSRELIAVLSQRLPA